MKIIFLFAFLNFLIAIFAVSSNDIWAADLYLSSALLLGELGWELYYFKNKKKVTNNPQNEKTPKS